MSKGILQVHPPICDCPGCRISSPVPGRQPSHPHIQRPPQPPPRYARASEPL
uniref:Sterile alpha motif domain containing 11 splice variant ASV44 n=1 Tax=Homo sapiens TaxID=9606 RepID=I7F491_HUMAN|nr:sterile alpha motif domain containing 11 splice variant ASV44 [Homo sapiens]AFP36461.1 sterile alpha motif domain containing 11 splice variant ASV45 [Homo sapiens]